MWNPLRTAPVLSWIFTVLTLASCGRGNRPIVIGLAGPLSDPVGAPMLAAARMAVDEINAAGGVRGRRLALEFYDDLGVTDSAVRIAATLSAGEAVAVIGHAFSRTTLAAAAVYAGAPIPIASITPSSSSPDITEAGDWLFRTCPTDLSHGDALAKWAKDGLQLDRGAVLYVNDEYGRGIRRAFVDRFSGLGGEILEQDPFLDSPPDMGPFLERIQQGGRTQFLMIAGDRPQAMGIIRQARALGLQMPILGGDGLEGIEQDGALANGAFVSSAYLPILTTPANRRFVDQYRNRFPNEGPPNQPGAATYDIIHLLARVIGESGVKRAAIRDGLSRVGREDPSYRGVTGPIGFDAHGDLLGQQVWISEVKDGAIKLAGER